MIWLLLVVFLLLMVGGCIGLKKDKDDGWWGAILIGGVASLLLLIILSVITVCNSVEFVKLKAFYQANSRNYEIAVDETASYLSEESFRQALIDGSIEKFELAGYVSDRISEWRDAANRYNIAIANMKYFDSTIFFGVLYPDELRDAKLLIID